MSQYTGQGPDPIDNLPKTECAARFKERMEGRVYDYQEFKAAWEWFKAGWRRACERV